MNCISLDEMDVEATKHIFEPSGTEVKTQAGGARRYRKPLRAVRLKDLQFLLSQSFDGWSKHNATRLGASLAFYTLFSLAPLLLVVLAVVGMVFGHSAAQRDIVQQVQMLVGPQGAKATEALLQGSKNTTHGIVATIAGLLTLLFGASGVMIELRDALNTIWEVSTPEVSGIWNKVKHYIKDRLFSFAMVLSVGFLLVVSLAMSAWIAALGAVSAGVVPGTEVLLHFINFLVSFIVITCLFAAIYKFMPDARIEWRDVLLGGAVTSLLFTIGKLLLGLYLGKASIASTYGAFASIVVLVVWVYYSAQIFFLGAEFTRSFANLYGSQPTSSKAAVVTANGQSAPNSQGSPIIKP